MKKSLLLLTLLLSACNPFSNTPKEDSNSVSENDVIEGQVVVNFLTKAEEWPAEEIVVKHKDYYVQHQPEYTRSFESGEEFAQTLAKNETLRFWKVGTIQNGDYAGQSLVLVRQSCDGPCPYSTFRYAVNEDTDTWTNLLPYSDELSEEMMGGPAPDQEASIEIPALEVPEKLDLFKNDSVYLADNMAELDPHFFATGSNWTPEDFDAYFSTPAFSDTSFVKYFVQEGNGCIYALTPDGVLARYSIVPTIFGVTPKNDGAYVTPVTSKTFTFVNNDPEETIKEKADYTIFAGGCGFANSCISTISTDSKEEANLAQVGTLDDRAVYTLKTVSENPTEGELAKLIAQAYEGYSMTVQYDKTREALTLAEFVAQKKVLLLKLDNGTYTLLYASDSAPSVECGKPVLYLYPEKAEQVNVKVNDIEFSKTIPAHGKNGWTVWAQPSGLLTNLADGLNYPYLFWEGQSTQNLPLSEGWTLAKNEVSTRLPIALAQMGLSKQETADFMEFWQPRLAAVSAPYIEFHFEGTAAMNRIAPLTITPAPDSLLRVFMYYQGVTTAGRSMPSYNAPARYGFSVIEWGGSLY